MLLSECRLIAVATVIVVGAPAMAQDTSVERRLEHLETDVMLLKRMASDGSAAAQAHDLQARVDALRGMMDDLARHTGAQAPAVEGVARLDVRLTALERDLATIRGVLSTPREESRAASFVAPAAADSGAVPLLARYRDGFELSDPAGRFALRTNAFLQFEYLGEKSQNDRDPTQSGVWLRRARLQWSGIALSPRLEYLISLEAGGERVQLFEAFVDLHATPSWSVRVGQFKVPFSRSWLVGDHRLAFPARSVATEEFRYDRDLGVMISGQVLDRRLQLALAGFNGAGPNVLGNDNRDPVLVARLSGTPLGRPADDQEGDWNHTARPSITLGAGVALDYVPAPPAYGYRFTTQSPLGARDISTMRDPNGDGRIDGVRVFQAGADLVGRWKGLELAGELYYRREAWGEVGQDIFSTFAPRTRFAGGLLQLTYVFEQPRLLAGVRYSYAEISPLALDGRQRAAATCSGASGNSFSCTLPYSDSRSELTFVAAWAPLGHGLKLSLAGSYLRWNTTSDLRTMGLPANSRDYRGILQLQAAF